MHFHPLLPFLALLLVSVVGCLPMPPSTRRPHRSHYENLYLSYLEPLNLYRRDPLNYAQITSAHSNSHTFNPLYTEMLLSDHPAYIHPSTANRLNPVLSRMINLTTRDEESPPTQVDQRGFVRLFEEATVEAKKELQIPLHPENIKAQHRYPLGQLLTKYTQLLNMLENPAHLERLTGLLRVEDKIKFEKALEVLGVESELLDVAIQRYAQTFPIFDAAA